MSAPVLHAAPPLIGGRCNPYGAETGGPRRVLGGLYGPNSATAPDADLPQSVAQGEWPCTRPAQVRCRMVCEHGHTGQVMALCSWHDEDNWRGELVAGTFRQVRDTVRVRGHFEEIQKRQSGSCPRCLFPGEWAAVFKESQSWAYELAMLHAAGMWRTPRAQEIRQKVEDIGKSFDEARALGIVHNCPLTLIPVS